MAKARVTCRCATCGKEFTSEKICRNRTEADSYEAWASEHIDECPECRRIRIASEARERAELIVREYNLPDVTGVSDKQIAYARDLRAKYISGKASLIPYYAKQRQYESTETLVSNLHAAAQRAGNKATLTEYRSHMARYEWLPVLFCTGDARRIIDCLTGRY